MAEKILMIALSPTMEEGVIQSWAKQEGDSISPGDVICEVETDKASMEYESSQSGELLKILMPAGEAAEVGTPIAIIGKKGEDISALIAESSTSATAPASAAPASASSTAPSAPASTKAPAAPAAPAAPVRTSSGRIKSSPLARRIAGDKNIDLSTIQGSGPGGRIVKADVIKAGTPASTAAHQSMQDERIPLTKIRSVIAQRLGESKFSAPHYYLKVSLSMESIIDARKALNAQAAEKVGMNAFFIKFVAEALRRHPEVNASWEGDAIRRFASIDIGLAVDRGNGLVTPVVRNCAAKSIVEIDAELRVLIQKAGDNKLRPEEYSNATFTISNLGSFGIEEFTAIINPPGSAILAIGATQKQPVVGTDNAITIEQRAKFSLSCDHRVIDGAVAARFLAYFKDIMEYPVRALF